MTIRDRHRSLYFDYEEYPFERPPELDGRTHSYPAVVVGAGPVGLAVALDLARRGIDVTVLEKDCMVSEGSRAICVSRRSLEILQGLGVAETLSAKALPWTAGSSFYRGHEIFRLRMPHSEDERYYPMVNIQRIFHSGECHFFLGNVPLYTWLSGSTDRFARTSTVSSPNEASLIDGLPA